ncbi:MAG: hypothetical protein RLZZ450_2639 [Pseudomonadota bacterium]|jgi:hypothetical protein
MAASEAGSVPRDQAQNDGDSGLLSCASPGQTRHSRGRGAMPACRDSAAGLASPATARAFLACASAGRRYVWGPFVPARAAAMGD